MPRHDPDPGPIEDRYREDMRELAALIDEGLNPGLEGDERTTGFVLLMFPFRKTGRMNYISNAERGQITKALRELVDSFEADAARKAGPGGVQ